MGKLDEALARLEQAVARLEAAAGAERRDAGLSDARETDNPELRAVAGQISVRVDDALARIARELGGGG